jgi:hypothetical protein
MCSHGFSLPLVSLSSTMWRHSLSSKIGQAPRRNAFQPWWHANNPPSLQAKHSQPFGHEHHRKFPGLAGWNLSPLEVPVLRVATNSPKSGLFILRRISNCSGVNRTELLCSSSLSGSSWSSWVLGASSPIDSGGTTRSLMGSSNMESCACLRFFLSAITIRRS